MKKVVVATLVMCLLSVFSAYSQEEKLELKAFYLGHEDGSYFFEDQFGDQFEFTACAESILAKFDLKSDALVSQAFLVKYKKLIADEENDDLEILSLEKIKLEKIEEFEEFEEENN